MIAQKSEMLRNKSIKIFQGWYAENYKTLMKELKDLNKWRNVPCSWIGRLNIVKMSVLPKLIGRFSTIPVRIAARFFFRYRQDYFKIYVKTQNN